MPSPTVTILAFAVVGLLACAHWDPTRNTVAARAEARQIERCSGEGDACSPAFVRASSILAYCANAGELAVHGAPVPEAGVSCQPK